MRPTQAPHEQKLHFTICLQSPSPVALVFCVASVIITLLGVGAFSANAQLKPQVIAQSTDPLVPVGFDCSRIRELGVDKQENLRAGAIMIACGEAEGGKPSATSALFEAIKNVLAPLTYGVTDVDLVTGAETSPNVTQSETFTASNPDNPNQIVVAYNDSRGRNASPINISGASVSTDGGNTFSRLTTTSWTNTYSGPSFPGPGVTAVGYFACMFTDGGGYWRHEGWGEPAALNGALHYVYAQQGAGSDPGDVYYIRSTDRGQTFSAPFKLNSDATTRPQWEPNLSVSSSGSVFAAWYDARGSGSCTRGNSGIPCYRIWGRRSTDNGVSWLSDQSFSDVVSPLPAQPDPGIQATYAGDYDYGTSSTNQHLRAWVDGRVANGGSSQQDAFHDRQPTTAPSATPTLQ